MTCELVVRWNLESATPFVELAAVALKSSRPCLHNPRATGASDPQANECCDEFRVTLA